MPTSKARTSELVKNAGKKEAAGPRWKAFVAAYARLGSVAKACEAAHISHASIRSALKKIPEFSAAFEQARGIIADKLEDALTQRAIEGTDKLKFDRNGKACMDPRTGDVYKEKDFSDIAAKFLLEGARPERYAKRFEHTGAGGGPIETSVTNLADLVKLAQTAKKPEPGKP